MSNHNEISSFIWRVCDDELRGLFKPHEYGEVILPFVVLRRLDCLLEPTKDEVVDLYNELKDQIDDPTPIIRKKSGLSFYNSSKFDLKRLKSDPNGLKMNFPNYLNGFSENVFQIIENFQLDKPVEKLLKNNKLYTLIDKFTEIDLHPEKIDNHTMGSIFEELLREFSEMSNETSGEHYTPRDIVNLLVSLVFNGDEQNLIGDGIIRTIFDPCCGTGGMLTEGKNWVNHNISKNVRFQLYGQELNPQTFSICKSDFLITGEEPNNIRLGSSLSNDQFIGKKFDYMITNPPFGVSWKSERDFIEDESKNQLGRFPVGLPSVTDGSLLFLLHLINKMRREGSKIGIIFNYSPLYSGDIGKGEHNIRKYLLDNDLIESIIQLPDELFFNTPITTFIWILNNKKNHERKNKIQLINSTEEYTLLRKRLNEKRKELSFSNIQTIINEYERFENTEISKVFDRSEFYVGKYEVSYDDNRKLDRYSKYEKIPLDKNIDELESLYKFKVLNKEPIDVGVEINFDKYFIDYKKVNNNGKSVIDSILEITEKINQL